jgi:GT2 family glycosyltransferase
MRCLNSLEKIEYSADSFLVVLIDCGVINGLEEFFRKSLVNYGIKIETFRLTDMPPGRPSGHKDARINEARNYAVKRAPGIYYVFTEDDCTFAPDWLHKFEASLSEETGALGGPDILPEGMEAFPRALDCILNSYLGTAGLRRGDGAAAANKYYPRKCNMLIPAKVLAMAGDFPEDIFMAGEMYMAGRIRKAGFRIEFLPQNPVWHRRVTTFAKFISSAAHMAYEKVFLMRAEKTFFGSLHFLIFMATLMIIFMMLLSLTSSHARLLLAGIFGAYLSALLITGASCSLRSHSLVVGAMAVFIMPLYQLGLISGVFRGVIAGRKLR